MTGMKLPQRPNKQRFLNLQFGKTILKTAFRAVPFSTDDDLNTVIINRFAFKLQNLL